MEGAHTTQWSNAQEITFSVDLFGAAKQELQFLAAVDSTGCLYDGPALERAIYRYKSCWLPLLAKHMEASVLEGPLVVPFDCEWIWHCHRLNPLQYKYDCEEVYGKILGTSNVTSTVEGHCLKQSESVWNNMYVTEPYNLDLANVDLPNYDQKGHGKDEKIITYDLVAAVKRQSTFFGKVSKDMKGVDVDGYLKAAVARYKAFLHMTKTVMESSNPEIYGVPTRDIDLIWHTHQLNPLAYCKDLKASVGVILDHNDRDIGTSEGKKMAEEWFERTKQLWKDSFGSKYLVGAGPKKKNIMNDAAGCACGTYNCTTLIPNRASVENNAAGCAIVPSKLASVEDNAPSCACAGSCSYNCTAIITSKLASVEDNAAGCAIVPSKLASVEDNASSCSCGRSCLCTAITSKLASVEDNAPGCACAGSCSYNCTAVVVASKTSSSVEDNASGCAIVPSKASGCAIVTSKLAAVEDNAPGCACAGSCSYNCTSIVVSNNVVDEGISRVCSKQQAAADSLGGLMTSTVVAAT